jgi:hypothetical protein
VPGAGARRGDVFEGEPASSWRDKISLQDVAMARSALKRPRRPALLILNAHHLYGPAAGDGDDLLLPGCGAFVDERCDHAPIESMGQAEQFLCDAVRSAPPRPFLCG